MGLRKTMNEGNMLQTQFSKLKGIDVVEYLYVVRKDYKIHPTYVLIRE